MSQAVTSTGIKVRRALFASPTTFADIGEIRTAHPGGKSRNKIETSTHNDGTESHVLGILRQRDPTFTINYVGSDATHASLNADIDGNIKNAWQFLYPSGTSRTGFAYLQKFDFLEATVDSVQGAELALVWSGPVVLVAL